MDELGGGSKTRLFAAMFFPGPIRSISSRRLLAKLLRGPWTLIERTPNLAVWTRLPLRQSTTSRAERRNCMSLILKMFNVNTTDVIYTVALAMQYLPL